MPTTAKSLSADESVINTEQDEWRSEEPSSTTIKDRVQVAVQAALDFIDNRGGEISFYEFERRVRPLVFTIGRLLVALFLCRRHEALPGSSSEWIDGRFYERSREESRLIATFFGKVRFWRTYMAGDGGGYHPLDRLLGLPADGFSLHLTGLMTLIATKMSYAQSTLVLRCFLGWSPSKDVVERSVLGLGRHTQAWFMSAAAPEGDGEVLVTEVDNKATPTATEAELKKRRGKRKPNPYPDSPRHRGRDRRRARGPKKRRKKGDKSKNGKATTVVTMYTLKKAVDARGRPILKGPINKKVYASYGGRRHAFAMARLLADKRGFTEESGKKVQIVSDGDPVLADLAVEFFPGATHTLDFIHAVEYVWKAGRSFHREGSAALEEWVDEYRTLIYQGRGAKAVAKLKYALRTVPKTGPGNKGKRKRLATAIGYFEPRISMMNYADLRKQDLVIGSGAVEGAVRHVVAERFDCTGMRWTRERAEPLLQLRCIEINGDWEAFLNFVRLRGTGSPGAPLGGVPLQAAEPGPLPTLGLELEDAG
jgi:hypothetical protein